MCRCSVYLFALKKASTKGTAGRLDDLHKATVRTPYALPYEPCPDRLAYGRRLRAADPHQAQVLPGRSHRLEDPEQAVVQRRLMVEHTLRWSLRGVPHLPL